jgi:hypothetical protein
MTRGLEVWIEGLGWGRGFWAWNRSVHFAKPILSGSRGQGDPRAAEIGELFAAVPVKYHEVL